MAGCACLLRQTGKFVKLFYVFHIIENPEDFYPACHPAPFAITGSTAMPPVQKPALGAAFYHSGGDRAAIIWLCAVIT